MALPVPGSIGQFPITAPDLRVYVSPGGMAVDTDDLFSETVSEMENLQQDLTLRLIEVPGSNADFGTPNTRGVGIMMYLNGTAAQIAGLPGRIDHEFEQDSRVITSNTAPAIIQLDGSYLIATQVTTNVGVFGYTWGWSQAGVAPL